MFYVPHWIWKNWEAGKIRMISDGIRGVYTAPMDERINRQSRLVRYIVDSLSTHNSYSFGYFFCELLNFINVVNTSKQYFILALFNLFLLDYEYCTHR